MNDDDAMHFINSLVKKLQVLCHGRVEFKQKVEVIGHLYVNVDSDTKFDYVVNEQVCRNEQSSTTFVSNSFHAGPKKTGAERKKELKEELAKMQKKEEKNHPMVFDEGKRNSENLRDQFLSANSTDQFNFDTRSTLRRDSYPPTYHQNEDDTQHTYRTTTKMPRLSFDDMSSSFDINELSNSLSLSQPYDITKESDMNETVYMDPTLSKSIKSIMTNQDTDVVDLTSIKEEEVPHTDSNNDSVTDKPIQPSNNFFNASPISRSNEMNMFSSISHSRNMNNHDFSMQSNTEITSRTPNLDLSLSGTPTIHVVHQPLANSIVGSSFKKWMTSTNEQRLCGISKVLTRSVNNEYNQKEKAMYNCETCKKSFKSSLGYKLHQNTHQGIYKFHCPVCNKGYQNSDNLNGHMNTHQNTHQTLYRCKKCGTEFKYKALLYKHEMKECAFKV